MIRPAFFLLALWAGSALAAEPYRPASADTVLLQRAPGAAETLRAARGVGADDPTARAQGIAAAIREARRSGDPRYYGQAQALLGADADRPEPPPEIRLLRATLRQQRHDFAGARSDLDALLAADPRNAQARLLRANIHLVQGEPVLAKPDCAALLGQTELLVTATCIGAVGGLTGQGAAGLAAIEQSLARAPEADATLKLWALTQAAEIAERLGDAPRASGHFATAVALAEAAGENDVYLKAAYADFLLRQQRAEQVRTLLARETAFDPLLLRLALASTPPTRERLAAELDQRFALARDRGDATHFREQAMSALHLKLDAAAALALAQQNWAEQREPADALILLEAALAAKNAAAAKPVLDWLQQTRLEDVRLRPLATRLEALK